MEKTRVRTKIGTFEAAQRMIEHELNRFGYMSRKQLWARLGKVTNPNKLVAMIHVARRFGRRQLANAAVAKLELCI